MDEQTLEPCPFCGGEANADGRTTYSKGHEAWWADGSQVREAFFVSCVKCGGNRRGIVGGQQTRAEAISAWNTRVIAGKVAELTERVDAALAILNDSSKPALLRVFDSRAALAPYPERRSE